jgi:serine/threonine protein kinase
MSTDDEATFDQLVCRISGQLEQGQEVDLAALQREFPAYAARVRDLLPTLQAMAALGSATTPALVRGGEEGGAAVSGVLGDFRIIHEIGRGGMGVVYEAEQISLGRRVALKILPFASVLDPRRMQRFQNEARAAASLHHPHIVPVFSVGCERGVHYYAMQFISGQSLDKIIQEMAAQRPRDRDPAAPPTRGPESTPQPTVGWAAGSTLRSTLSADGWRQMARLISQVADAIEHAHQQGIIHRDIKPANLMFDASGKIWITDFGLAQIESSDTLTVSGDLLGTLRYMSPEQLSGRPGVTDPRSDVYSLGVTLYEVLALEPAFAGRDRKQLIHDILLTDPPSLRQKIERLPRELDVIVGKAMAKDPADRYQSAADLAADLRRYLNNQPILARKPSRWQRASKWCQRHIELVAASAAAAVLLGLVAVSTSLLLWNQATRLSAALDSAKQATTAAETSRRLAEEARVLESEARQTAVARAAEAAQLLNFLEKQILAVARPAGLDGGLGRDVTLRQVIDQALPKIETQFRGQPRTEMELRRVLGVSYEHLAQFEDSRRQFLRAYELAQQELGADHLTTLGNLVNLGNADLRCGDVAGAAERLSHAWESLQRRFPKHAYTEICLANLADLERQSGRSAVAAEKWEQVLAMRQARLGPTDLTTIGTVINLAMVYEELGRVREAETMLRPLVVDLEAQFGSGHPETWQAAGLLATVDSSLGNRAAAVEARQKLLAAMQETLGPEHLSVLGGQVNLALALEGPQDAAQAETLLQAALPLLKQSYPNHPFTLRGMNTLAGNRLSQGQISDAIDLYRETLVASREQHGPEHIFTLGVRVNLANAWLQNGQTALALSTYRQVLRLLQQQHPDHEFTWVATHSFAQALVQTGQHSAAATILKKLLDETETRGDDRPAIRLQTQVRLANCYRILGKQDAAADLLEPLLPRLRRDHRDEEMLAIALGDLAIIRSQQNQFSAAAELFAEAHAVRTEQAGSDHPSTLGVLVNWGITEWMGGQSEVAADRLESALVKFRQGQPHEPFYGICLKQLIALAEDLGRTQREVELLMEFEQWLLSQGGDQDPQTFRVRVRRAQLQANWESAEKWVDRFESQVEMMDEDFALAAALRHRLAEMRQAQNPQNLAAVQRERNRAQAWLKQAQTARVDLSEQAKFDPALRRLLSPQLNP